MPLSVPRAFLFSSGFEGGDFSPISWAGRTSLQDAPHVAPAYPHWRDSGSDASGDAIWGYRSGGVWPSNPQAFVLPTSGVATNGLPIYNWDQAAQQLTRDSNGWAGLGNPANITFAFRSTAPSTMPSDTSGFLRFTEAQIAMTLDALALWSDVANITFTRVDGGDGYSNNATMLFSNYTAGADGASAFAYYPGLTGAGSLAGDVWINFSLETNNSNLVEGEFGPHTMAHEIGHAIGIAHPADYDALDGVDPAYPGSSVYWQDGRLFTVMSYFGSLALGGSLNAFASGPQLHDIAAAQLLYGANMSTRTGDTIYGFNSNTGHAHFTITADGQSPVFAIWDAGGNDTLDLSGYSTAVEVDLRAEAFSSAGPGNGGIGIAIGNISIARGAVIENGIGGSAGDVLIGNDVANVLEGRAGADTMSAGVGADTLYGGDGDDILNGETDNDRLEGGNHNDTLNGGDGVDTLFGDAGNDVLNGGAGADQMSGGGGDDIYTVDNVGDVAIENASSGTDVVQSLVTYALGVYVENLTLLGGGANNGVGNVLANIITGNGAANTLSGLAGADTLIGSTGADTLNGGDGNDTLDGGNDNDLLDGGNDNDTLNGGLGADTLFGRSGADTLNGDSENDTIYGGDGDDTINGGSNDDLLDGGNNNDTIYGSWSADTLYGRAGDDILNGDSDDDIVYGGDGDDLINGGDWNDLLDGGNQNDTINGGHGVDEMYGRTGNDTLNGDIGNDALYGGDGDDVLSGGDDDDLLDGGNFTDVLNGGDGADTLYGRNGADTLDGGLGGDILFGGNDADTFVFSTTLGGGNVDTIQFFSAAQDVIHLDVGIFTAIGSGVLGAEAFVIGSAATDADDRIIYNSATGALSYDADGDGAGVAIQFATLATGLSLTNDDFFGFGGP